MKIKFKHSNLKVLVTRISGKFNICSETNKKWDNKLTNGSFRINDDVLYDKILESITEIKSILSYRYWRHFLDNSWRYYDFHSIHGDLIFTVENGIVKDVVVDDPKEEIIYYITDEFGMNPHHNIDLISNSFNPPVSEIDLSNLPQNVIDKMKEIDEKEDMDGEKNER